MTPNLPILILGVGNLLMGDEGVGIHAVESLKNEKLPCTVDIVDGGTGGFHLLSYLENYEIIILIDATMDRKKVGTISLIEPRYSADFPKTLSAHDIGLKDLVESSAILGYSPKIYLITVTIKDIRNMTMELSEEVKPSIPGIISQIHEILTREVAATLSAVRN